MEISQISDLVQGPSLRRGIEDENVLIRSELRVEVIKLKFSSKPSFSHFEAVKI